MYIRHIILGSGLVSLVPVVKAATPVQESAEPSKPPAMRPSDLPLYDTPHADYGEYLQNKDNKSHSGFLRSALQPPVQVVREQLQTVWLAAESTKNTVQEKYTTFDNDFHDKTQWIVQYLREEDNKTMRYGAVAMSGLTGFIFGLRGGLIKRLFYTGIGTTIGGYVCFPEETKEIINNNSIFVKQYMNIAYNFLYGVKPGDPQLEIKFPDLTFPTKFSELVDLSMSLATTVKQVVMPPQSNVAVDNKPNDNKN